MTDFGPQGAAIAAQRAAMTMEALRSPALFSERSHLFGRRRWFLRSYEYLWPYGGAWSAAATWAALSREEKAIDFLEGFLKGVWSYHRPPRPAIAGEEPLAFGSSTVSRRGPGGDVYYDDNAWVGLALVAHHALTGNETAWKLARRLLRFVVTGWSDDPSWSRPGGIRWKVPTDNRSRNTCSNAPVAELAALVHQRDGDQDALGWAERIYRWTNDTLRGSDDLYLDQIAPDGTLDPTVWSYNQGTMIGAGVLLHRVTGRSGYLEQAVSTAQAAVGHFSTGRLIDQEAAFNAVFFRNLLLLDETSPDPAYRRSAEAYGEAMWAQRRDPGTGIFAGHGSFLNDTAPMVEIYALLAGAPAHA